MQGSLGTKRRSSTESGQGAWKVSKMHVWEERLVRNCENGLNPDAKLVEDKKFGAKLCEQAVGIWQGHTSVWRDQNVLTRLNQRLSDRLNLWLQIWPNFIDTKPETKFWRDRTWGSPECDIRKNFVTNEYTNISVSKNLHDQLSKYIRIKNLTERSNSFGATRVRSKVCGIHWINFFDGTKSSCSAVAGAGMKKLWRDRIWDVILCTGEKNVAEIVQRGSAAQGGKSERSEEVVGAKLCKEAVGDDRTRGRKLMGSVGGWGRVGQDVLTFQKKVKFGLDLWLGTFGD